MSEGKEKVEVKGGAQESEDGHHIYQHTPAAKRAESAAACLLDLTLSLRFSSFVFSISSSFVPLLPGDTDRGGARHFLFGSASSVSQFKL